MKTVRIVLEVRDDERVADIDREVIQLARRLGASIDRSNDPRMPLFYTLRQQYVQPRDSNTAA